MNKIVLPASIVTTLRILSILFTLVYGIRISEYSLGFLALTLASLYLIKKRPNYKNDSINILNRTKLENPFLKVKKTNLNELPPNVIEKTKNELFNHFLVDYSYGESLNAFNELKNKSECIFSKKSNLWGAPKWNDNLTINENIKLIVPSFILFCNFCTNLKLDGYLVQLSGEKYGKNLQDFSRAFCEVLTHLSKFDPTGLDCMKETIDRRGWVFQFSNITFFITSFAPLYPESSSRYTFGIDECFILFQPEISFAINNLPEDTEHTNWNDPKTVRDKIRIGFRNAGREYLIRETVRYPMAYDMVKPINKDDPIVEWWKHKPNLILNP